MARLYEYQGKQLLKAAKVPIPQGGVAATPQEARNIAEKIGKPVAIKAQIWAGGRGKAGGIKFAEHPLDAEIVANDLLGSEIKNLKVEKVLVEEKLDIFEEDNDTKAVAIFGEIGGPYEEEAAEAVRQKRFTKPLVVFVAGAWAPEGMRFSHASSIIERGKGSAKDKIKSLKEAGVHVVDRPDEIAPTLKRLLSA
jgi:hypothetical protein